MDAPLRSKRKVLVKRFICILGDRRKLWNAPCFMKANVCMTKKFPTHGFEENTSKMIKALLSLSESGVESSAPN